MIGDESLVLIWKSGYVKLGDTKQMSLCNNNQEW